MCGINDDQIQKRLLAEGDKLTLTEATSLAQAIETAMRDSQVLQPHSISVQRVITRQDDT